MTPDEILHEILDDCADCNIAADGDKLLKALNDNGYTVIGAAELDALRAEIATLKEDYKALHERQPQGSYYLASEIWINEYYRDRKEPTS